MKPIRYKFALLSLLALPVTLLVTTGGSATAAQHASATGAAPHVVTTSSLGTFKPTFVGTAATGCASGCHLLTGPVTTASTAHLTASQTMSARTKSPDRFRALPLLRPRVPATGARSQAGVIIPTVSCVPPSASCDSISTSTGGAVGVKGLNAVDSAKLKTNVAIGDVEPPDQGLCAGNGSVVETNNIGEILIFNKALKRVSPVISMDTIMGLTQKKWSSGGDPSCLYDSANGGHWFFTEIASASPESKGGPFAGCFISGAHAVANSCYEAIAVTKGSNPFGPYNVYYLKANYNPKEPGAPYLLNDYAKISASRDAFLLFYDEFPLKLPGIGGGAFNGAQQLAFNKNALEKGLPVSKVTVAIENMGLLPTPNGTCAKDKKYGLPGISCWFSVIPAVPPNSSEYDNSHGGSAFMLATLDFYDLGGNQLAAFDWTGLKGLNSSGCSACSAIRFGGTLFSGLLNYYDNPGLPSGLLAPQKPGPIPLGNECGKAGLSVGNPPPATCPESGVATNSDQVTQASQARGQLWVAVTTQVQQLYANDNIPEAHMAAVYWVVGTSKFDKTGLTSFTSQGYVSPAHEDLAFPTMAAGASNGRAIISFTLTGNGGELFADNGGFYPSSAFGRLTSTSAGLLNSTVNIADLGLSPQDGATEYQFYPGGVPFFPRPRWGDYGNAIFVGGKYYFASEYIQSPNCVPPKFTLTIGTCGGTRDGFANWGTSVNSVTP